MSMQSNTNSINSSNLYSSCYASGIQISKKSAFKKIEKHSPAPVSSSQVMQLISKVQEVGKKIAPREEKSDAIEVRSIVQKTAMPTCDFKPIKDENSAGWSESPEFPKMQKIEDTEIPRAPQNTPVEGVTKKPSLYLGLDFAKYFK
jgi:hypothetical protein